MPLNDEEKATLAALQKKAEEPEPAAASSSRVENINLTIDLSDDAQVRRAVRAGYLPASYLEDDGEEGGEGEEGEGEEGTGKRRARFE